MRALYQRMRELLHSENGPTATEYAIMLALIAVAVIGALSSFGVRMDNIYTSITGTMPTNSGS